MSFLQKNGGIDIEHARLRQQNKVCCLLLQLPRSQHNRQNTCTKWNCFSMQCSSISKRTLLSGRFSGIATLPSRKSNMYMENWWNYNDTGKTKYKQQNLSQCHTVHQISHTDWLGIEPLASAVTGRRLPARTVARPKLQSHIQLPLQIQLLPRSKHIMSRYKNRSLKAVP
jgi:hypothetical protein